jgi:hypothetical protein
VCATGQPKLETHLGFSHEVAILYAVVRNRESRQPQWTGLTHGLDHPFDEGRVLDLELHAGVPTAGLFED